MNFRFRTTERQVCEPPGDYISHGVREEHAKCIVTYGGVVCKTFKPLYCKPCILVNISY